MTTNDMIVMEALQWATQQLKTHPQVFCASPLLEAETLLSELLQKPKALLIAHMEQDLSLEQWEQFQDWIKRRCKHEPVAYLVGKKEFYGRSFIVNPSVLIPRPATETLVDLTLEAAKEMHPDRSLFLDIGTGSGVIAITLVAESGIPAIATDLSKEALEIARLNAQHLGVEEKIHFLEGNLLEPILPLLKSMMEKRKQQPAAEHLEQIILCANLPYLTHTQWEEGQKDVRDFEPKSALTSGVDGLDAYFELFKQIKKYRRWFPERLTLLCEMDPSQSRQMMALLSRHFPTSPLTITKDLEGYDRVIQIEL